MYSVTIGESNKTLRIVICNSYHNAKKLANKEGTKSARSWSAINYLGVKKCLKN